MLEVVCTEHVWQYVSSDSSGTHYKCWCGATRFAEAPPVDERLAHCVVCGKLSMALKDRLVFWRTSDGFHIHWPTCGCGNYVVCQECNAKNLYQPCPVCGCGCEYT